MKKALVFTLLKVGEIGGAVLAFHIFSLLWRLADPKCHYILSGIMGVCGLLAILMIGLAIYILITEAIPSFVKWNIKLTKKICKED